MKLEHSISFHWLIAFAMPTIISSIFMNVYSAVDGVFVARFVNTDALSAINITLPIIYLITAIGMMFGSGGNALVAKKIGEGKQQEAKEDFSLLIVVVFFSSILLAILFFSFLRPICLFLGADEALPGFRIVALSFLMMAYNVFSSGWFTALNDGRTSAILSFTRTIIFMVLPVLILPEILGINGVWLSMNTGEAMSLIMTIYYFLKYQTLWKKE